MKNKSSILRFLICAVLFCAVVFGGILSGVLDVKMPQGFDISLSKALKILAVVLGVIAVEGLLTFILKHIKTRSHRAESVLSVVASVLRYVAAVVIICWVLSIIGLNMSAIVISVGILAMIVGFSAESLIADLVTGAFIVFEGKYNVGDIIEVDGFRGKVTEIGIRTTSLTDDGGNIRVVNNSAMQNIMNRSGNVSTCVSDIAVGYGTDLSALCEILPEILAKIKNENGELFPGDIRYLGLQNFGEYGLVLRFAAEVRESDIYKAMRAINGGLYIELRSRGIECCATV